MLRHKINPYSARKFSVGPGFSLAPVGNFYGGVEDFYKAKGKYNERPGIFHQEVAPFYQKVPFVRK